MGRVVLGARAVVLEVRPVGTVVRARAARLHLPGLRHVRSQATAAAAAAPIPAAAAAAAAAAVAAVAATPAIAAAAASAAANESANQADPDGEVPGDLGEHLRHLFAHFDTAVRARPPPPPPPTVAAAADEDLFTFFVSVDSAAAEDPVPSTHSLDYAAPTLQVGRSRLPLSKPVLKAPMVSALYAIIR